MLGEWNDDRFGGWKNKSADKDSGDTPELDDFYKKLRKLGVSSEQAPEPLLSPELEESTLQKVGRMTYSAVDGLGYALDTPGAFARGIIAGDPLSFLGDSERRVSGKDLNEMLGISSPTQSKWISTPLGLATEIVTDPLSWIHMPMSALTKAGKAAKAAGLLDLAPIAAQTKMGVTPAAKTLAGRFTDDAYKGLLPRGLARTPENYAVRPLLGPRLARTEATLDDVVKASKDPKAAMDDVLKYLKVSGDKYDDIKDTPLGGAMGFGFFTPWTTVTPTGSKKVLDAMDLAGQAISWSYPSRVASAWFNKDVSGFIDPLDQMSAMRRSQMAAEAAGEGRKLATRHAMLMDAVQVTPQAARLLGSDTLFSKQGNEFLTRLFEGKLRGVDSQIRAALPGIDAVEKSWDSIRSFNVNRGKSLGMRVNPYSDQYGTLYSPRRAAELVFDDYGYGAGNALFNTATTEGYSRSKYLITPGGTDDLRQASLLPIVRDHAIKGDASPYTDAQVGKSIADFINKRNNTNAVSADQGTWIAKAMKRINKDLPTDYPVFAEHPIAAQARNIVNQNVAAANARYIYEALAESAVNSVNTGIVGGNFRRLDSTLNEVARRTGLATNKAGSATNTVQQNLLAEVSKRTGIPINKLDIGQLAVPERVYNRLMKLQDFYSSPLAQEEVAGLFNKFTSVTKAFLLAWPSRHVRDMYSNLFASWLETGSAADTLTGFRAAKAIIGGNFDEAAPLLRTLPQYQGLANTQAIRRKFLEDTSQGGVLSTLATSDLLTATVKGDINQLVPGSTPMTRLGSFKEMIPDGSRNPLQQAQDFFSIRSVSNDWETKNAVLNWSTKLSDTNDSIARLGTFIALLKQGNTVSEAASRTGKALVDYSSLTGIERHYLRNIFPWWAYNSRIGKYVSQHIMQHPGGRMAQVVRGMHTLQASDDQTNIPTSLRQQFAVRMPSWLNPYSTGSGVTTYLTDIDFPGIDVLNLPRGTVQDTFGELANQSHPLFRTAAELAMNRDFFSKRPLDESTTRLDRIYQALSGRPTGMPVWAKAIIQNIPGGQRPINFFGGLADERIPDVSQRLVRELSNATLGVKFRDVDQKWVEQDMLRKLAEQQRGWARTGMYSGIPDELFPFAPPDVQAASLTAKSLQRKVNKRMREEKKMQAATQARST